MNIEKVLKKYNIPTEFKVCATFYNDHGNGINVPEGNFNYDFIKYILLSQNSTNSKLKCVYLNPLVKLTVYSQPNNLGSFVIYDNPSNELKLIEFNDDFDIKSFSIQSNDEKDKKYFIDMYEFSNSENNINSNSDSNLDSDLDSDSDLKNVDKKNNSYILCIFIILILISFVYFYYQN